MKFKVFKKMKKIIAIDLRYAESPYTGLTRCSKKVFRIVDDSLNG